MAVTLPQKQNHIQIRLVDPINESGDKKKRKRNKNNMFDQILRLNIRL